MRRLRLIQAAVIFLVLVGGASVGLIGAAIQDIYGKLDNAVIRLCVVELRVRNLSEAIGGQQSGLMVPQRPPPQRECRAKPGK